MSRADLKRRAGNVRAWIRRLWSAAAGGLPDDWEATERDVQRRMHRPLLEYSALVRAVDDLAFDLLKQVRQLQQPQEVFQAHITLLAQVLQDLRVASLLAQSGYVMQSWAVSASAFEAAHTMGFISADTARANQWLAYRALDRPFCHARTGIEGSFQYLEIGSQGKRRVDLVDREYTFYERLCLAKHVHPVAERTRYLGRSGRLTRLILTPYFSARRVREARLGLLMACRSATLALWVFYKAHTSQSDQERARLTALMAKTSVLLDTWKEIN